MLHIFPTGNMSRSIKARRPEERIFSCPLRAMRTLWAVLKERPSVLCVLLSPPPGMQPIANSPRAPLPDSARASHGLFEKLP